MVEVVIGLVEVSVVFGINLVDDDNYEGDRGGSDGLGRGDGVFVMFYGVDNFDKIVEVGVSRFEFF